MPKKEIDYKKAMIYKICCNDLKVKDIYIGSTTEFTKRKTGHKSRCNNENNKCYNFNVNSFIRDNGGWDNWSMILVERYPCNDNYELKSRERYYIETLNATLNSIIPNRTNKEYRIDNKEQILKNQKKYRKEHKENQKKYREKQKENQKKYKEEHKEKLKTYIKEYKKKNKHNITRREICECGTSIQLYNKIRHQKTEQHKALISNPFINFKL